MKSHKDQLIDSYIDIVLGTKGYVKRILKTRGCSDATIDDVMEKIEAIIEHSGKLGRVIQREVDSKYIQELKTNAYTSKGVLKSKKTANNMV